MREVDKQWFDARRSNDLTPEMRLVAAIIAQAIEDIDCGLDADAESAIRFISSKRLAFYCSLVGLDEKRVEELANIRIKRRSKRLFNKESVVLWILKSRAMRSRGEEIKGLARVISGLRRRGHKIRSVRTNELNEKGVPLTLYKLVEKP